MSREVQILSPDHRVLTVRSSSVPMYLRRGCVLLTEEGAPSDTTPPETQPPTTSAPKSAWVSYAQDLGWDDAAGETKNTLIEVLTSPLPEDPSTAVGTEHEES